MDITIPRIFLTVRKNLGINNNENQKGGSRTVNNENRNEDNNDEETILSSKKLKEIMNKYNGNFGNNLISLYEMTRVIESTE
jgi:hypothetical protein